MNRGPIGSSGFKGVCMARSAHSHQKRWRAVLYIGKKQLYLGTFDNEISAACAYDAAAVMYLGTDTYLNFPSGYRV